MYKSSLCLLTEQRAHGVGYYQFSKDEQDRKAEMERLNKIREETKSQREAKKKLLDKRKAALSARLEKVKQRRIGQGKTIPETKGMFVMSWWIVAVHVVKLYVSDLSVTNG